MVETRVWVLHLHNLNEILDRTLGKSGVDPKGIAGVHPGGIAGIF